MNKKLQVKYHADKLVLVYQIPETFMTTVTNSVSFSDLMLIQQNYNVFIFTPKYMSENYTCPTYKAEYVNPRGEHILIAEFRNDIYQAITMRVDNKLFYTGNLNLLYKFEEAFNLSLQKIIQLDVACDSNINLPKKLNDFIHRPDCELRRIGSKLPSTAKGNQVVGTKVLPNIKMTAAREMPKASFYYQLMTSGNRRPVVFRGYNKSEEISQKSHKKYIEEANGFGDTIYRFEVSIVGRDIRQRAKKDERCSLEFVYRHLTDQDYLKELFVKYVNRIANLWVGKCRYKISEILRLD